MHFLIFQSTWNLQNRMKFLRRNRRDKSDVSEEPAEEDEEEDTSFDDKTVDLQEEMGKRSRDRNIAHLRPLMVGETG